MAEQIMEQVQKESSGRPRVFDDDDNDDDDSDYADDCYYNNCKSQVVVDTQSSIASTSSGYVSFPKPQNNTIDRNIHKEQQQQQQQQSVVGSSTSTSV